MSDTVEYTFIIKRLPGNRELVRKFNFQKGDLETLYGFIYGIFDDELEMNEMLQLGLIKDKDEEFEYVTLRDVYSRDFAVDKVKNICTKNLIYEIVWGT